MQCVVVVCVRSVRQCVAVYCSVCLLCVAFCCSVLYCVCAFCPRGCPWWLVPLGLRVAVRCSVLQWDAACCSVLQRVAACCSVLQRFTSCCSVLQFVYESHCFCDCCTYIYACIHMYIQARFGAYWWQTLWIYPMKRPRGTRARKRPHTHTHTCTHTYTHVHI